MRQTWLILRSHAQIPVGRCAVAPHCCHFNTFLYNPQWNGEGGADKVMQFLFVAAAADAKRGQFLVDSSEIGLVDFVEDRANTTTQSVLAA